jgi:lysyl-tRNA synthetase class 2
MLAVERVELLRRRAEIVRGMRAFFDGEGFVEVETPVRIDAPAPEEHIDCPPVATGGFLRASPELQMKKLLAEGMERIYQIGPCFRDGERGERHNPEFTMVEWYRRGAGYLDIADDLERLLARLGLPVRARRLRVRDAYRAHAGWDPWEGAWDGDRFDFDMATKVEPALAGMGGGVFLTDYPPQAASLARVSRGGEPFAERWEFYWGGMELANCFTELCDGGEQRTRFCAAREARRALGEADYPLDEEFLAAVPRMESAAGVALGVDRLVMVLTGARSISDVRVAR